MNYEFEIERIVRGAKRSKRTGLQFPEGLKTEAIDIAREIEQKTKSVTIIFADPCYGACDTKEIEAKKLGVDVIFQFGHDAF